jgi:hypothetical protein
VASKPNLCSHLGTSFNEGIIARLLQETSAG